MSEIIMKELSSFIHNPTVQIFLLFSFGIFILSFRFVNDLSYALETVGIKLTQQDKKKWRVLLRTSLMFAFIFFVFCHLYVLLFRY
jgi:hypothetical protein